MQRPSRLYSRVLSALLPTLIVGLAIPFNGVRAEVPSGPPTFGNPLNIDNAYFPFQPGGMKVFTGNEQRTKTGVIDYYRTGTRTFRWNGKNVACRLLVEEAYHNDELVERSFNYFAQANDGTVYYFGEVVDNYENGVIVNHDGSWLVGGATLPSDPPGIGNAPNPAVFMPAKPELGDVFKPEDLFPIVDETAKVVGVDLDVLVPAGNYDSAIKVEESTRLAPGTELKWYAPGVGVLKVQTNGVMSQLVYSTLVQPQDD
jgi:hypothetical protein